MSHIVADTEAGGGSPGRKLTLLPLVMVMFFTVSGGAYGLEDLIGTSGPGMGLILIIVTPVIWSFPTALMVAELSTAMPVPGGYYAWCKKALGPFWGFQEAWWSWITSFVDMAIYPVLFADYLSTLLIQAFDNHILEENPLAHWLVTLVVIWSFALWNIRGPKSVGSASNLFGAFILTPFLIMALIGIFHLIRNPTPFWLPLVPPDKSLLSSFGTGLFVVMWNYLGWDALSTVSDDIHLPKRNYPRGLALTIPLVGIAYLLPVIAGLAAAPDWAGWTAGYFPTVATQVGGWGLGAWLAIGGLVSAAGVFSALMMSISRLPLLLAEDGYLPALVKKKHPKYGTPWVAIVICACVYSLFTLSAFSSLVVVDVIVYSAALILEFAALIVLRWTEPGMKRPVRVPGGWAGVFLVTAFPVAVVALAVYSTWEEEGVSAIYMSAAALATGPLIYPLLKRFVKGNQPSTDVPIDYEEAPAPAK